MIVELTTFLILNFLAALFTVLIICFKLLPAEQGDELGGWQGIAFISTIISTIIWLVCAASCLGIGTISSYAVFNVTSGAIETGSVLTVFPDTSSFALIYVLISVLPFVLIFYLWPETWRKSNKE
jgi:hypothetical protein